MKLKKTTVISMMGILFFLFGCSYGKISSDYVIEKNSDKGVAIMSFTISGTRDVPISLRYRQLKRNLGTSFGAIPFFEFSEELDWKYPKKISRIPRGEFEGRLVVFQLPPGDYEFHSLSLPDGFDEAYWRFPDAFSFKFKILPQKAHYIGNVHLWIDYGHRSLWYELFHTNEAERDLALFHKKYPLIKKDEVVFQTPEAQMEQFLLDPLPEDIPEHVKESLKLKPEDAQAHSNRAFLYIQMKLHKQALAHINEALKLEPEMAEAYARRGLIFSRANRSQEAWKDFMMAIQLDPDLAEVYTYRGELLIRQGHFDDAVKDLNRAIGLEPGNYINYFIRGALNIKRIKLEEAFQDVEKIIDLNSASAHGYILRGAIHRARLNDTLMCSDLKKACDLGECKPYNNMKEDEKCTE